MIHTFLVDPAEEARTAMARALGSEPEWVGHDSLAQLAQSIDEGSLPAVVLLGPGIVHDDTMVLARSIQDEDLPVVLIQFAKTLDPDRLRDAMRAGVADVVTVEADDAEVQGAFHRALRTLQHRTAGSSMVGPTTPAPVVAVVAGKGGVGASLVATNLSVAMARSGVHVGLVDLDVGSGDLAIMLQKRPNLGILDAVARIDHLDSNALDGFLTPVNDRISLLAAPVEGGELHVPTGPFLHLVRLLGEVVDVMVVDVGVSHDATGRAVLAEASKVVVVTNREVTAIRGTRRVIGELEGLGVSREAIRLVVNQSDVSTGLSLTDLSKSLKTAADVFVPSDKNAGRSVNQGDPLVNRRRSRSGQALTELADELLAALDLADTE